MAETNDAQAHVELLAGADLFSGLDRIALAKLAAYLDPLPVSEGEAVVTCGEEGNSLYLIAQGSFGVFVAGPDGKRLIQVATLRRGACFGEMALLTGEVRSATVQALGDGEVLRLDQARFMDVLRQEPSIGLAVSATLSRRLRDATQGEARTAEALGHTLDRYLAALDEPRRTRVLQASLLDDTSEPVLQAVFGTHANEAARDTAGLQVTQGRFPIPIAEGLRQRLPDSERLAFAETAARSLAGAGFWPEALSLANRFAPPEAFQTLLARAPADSARPWSVNAEAKAEAQPVQVLEEARGLRFPGSRAVAFIVATGLALGAAWAGGSSPQLGFLLLLAAAVALWVTGSVPDFAVWLALVTGWVLFDVATPAQALSGLSSASWLAALAILGIAAAVSNAGLLFRFGLVLIRHMPSGLFAQAATLLLTGVLLAPLLPSSTARARMVMPIALFAAQNQRLQDRSPQSALLGLACFVGCCPLLFLFLNGSTSCLLALGLLPEASRARFDFIQWFVAAAPLAFIAGAGWLVLMWLVLRPGAAGVSSQARLDLQMALLGKPGRRELAMAAILVATVVGWNLAPTLGIHGGIVGLISLLAAVLAGCFDRRSLHALNWEFLVSYGVILAMSNISITLGIDRAAAEGLRTLLGGEIVSPLAFILGIAVLNLLVRFALPDDQALVLLSLALVPASSVVGIEPWLVSVTLLATFTIWFFPSQTVSFMVGSESSEERLFTPHQARLAYGCYAVAVFAGLVLSVPYWDLLGLL